jgi:hypothetical protein
MITEETENTLSRGQKSQKLQDEGSMKIETSEELKIYPTFESMKLKEELLRGIYCYGKVL